MADRRRVLQNRLLRSLPPPEFRRLTGRAKLVHLKVGEVLHGLGEPGPYVYFPMSGVCSLALVGPSGEMLQVASIGCEGVTSVASTYWSLGSAQMHVGVPPGTALQVPRDDFEREMDARLTLRSHVRQFYAAFQTELMLAVACNRLHSMRERYCRHLLGLADRLGSDHLPLTHTMVASLLGTTRSSVTLISIELKRQHAIAYNRNLVTIVDRLFVESAACSCYRAARARLKPLLPPRH